MSQQYLPEFEFNDKPVHRRKFVSKTDISRCFLQIDDNFDQAYAHRGPFELAHLIPHGQFSHCCDFRIPLCCNCHSCFDKGEINWQDFADAYDTREREMFDVRYKPGSIEKEVYYLDLNEFEYIRHHLLAFAFLSHSQDRVKTLIWSHMSRKGNQTSDERLRALFKYFNNMR